MTADDLKRAAAFAALPYLPEHAIIGVGTGSTANHFIDLLGPLRDRIAGAVSSSVASTERLRRQGIRIVELDAVESLPVYVDGADEVDDLLQMIKGGGGALTREKIVAAVAQQFICIADASKLVKRLGRFPLPIEVIPIARGLVLRHLTRLGGEPRVRDGFLTDNGNLVIDVHGLAIDDAKGLEAELDHVPGIVTNGLFARRGADIALIAGDSGVVTLRR